MVQDLIYDTPCKPFSVDLRSIATIWKNKDYIIEAKLLGEHGEYYIEIKYSKSNLSKKIKKDKRKKIMKKL